MNLKDVVTFIITDDSVDNAGLDALIVALRERQKINKATARYTLSTGMTVRIGNIKPKYYTGVVGVITGFNKTRTRANIKVTSTNGYNDKVFVGQVVNGFPVSSLTEIAVAPKSVITEEDEGVLYDFMNGRGFGLEHDNVG